MHRCMLLFGIIYIRFPLHDVELFVYYLLLLKYNVLYLVRQIDMHVYNTHNCNIIICYTFRDPFLFFDFFFFIKILKNASNLCSNVVKLYIVYSCMHMQYNIADIFNNIPESVDSIFFFISFQ